MIELLNLTISMGPDETNYKGQNAILLCASKLCACPFWAAIVQYAEQ